MGKKREVLKGVCYLYSETGTEGGYWVFQDNRFISKVMPSFGVYAGGDVWDSKNRYKAYKWVSKTLFFVKI